MRQNFARLCFLTMAVLCSISAFAAPMNYDLAKKKLELLKEHQMLRGAMAVDFIHANGLIGLLDIQFKSTFEDGRNIQTEALHYLAAMDPEDTELQTQICLSKIIYDMGGSLNLPLAPSQTPLFRDLLLKVLQAPSKLALARKLPVLLMPSDYLRSFKTEAVRLRLSLSFPVEKLYELTGEMFMSVFRIGRLKEVSEDMEFLSPAFVDVAAEFSKIHPEFLADLAAHALKTRSFFEAEFIYRTLENLPERARAKVIKAIPSIRTLVLTTLQSPFSSFSQANMAFQLLFHNTPVTPTLIDADIEIRLVRILNTSRAEVLDALPVRNDDEAKMRSLFYNEIKVGALRVLALANKKKRLSNPETLAAIAAYEDPSERMIYVDNTRFGVAADRFQKAAYDALRDHSHLGLFIDFCRSTFGPLIVR